ncbi:protein SMAX1-LIKE 6 [Beta vulgaris subsp. vulgaris]|uniref:protein SMAX1-LIKE 6 n=1 Tax=Beta vulgaris subsp. vulgaris TaxID=3555 RepID=UPI00254811E1|nr:protein SMAX1-LIKE 6 [Beta vulgaris subsp. vulgaris]
MPTAVTTARQCLTDEAAKALDDAVSVAKRRNHAQTTSLHAVSALLSPSISLLRESLTRCRSSAYSPRLQFRALELCVGVSLDRLPSSKTTLQENDDFAPPISNSLMAAIKRSQANQRRQPEMYHFNHLHVTNNIINNSINNNNNNNSNNNNMNNNNGNISISSIKVELKHFVLSILDDPIVSRVFGEAGFRSSEIKLAILHPPRWGPSPSSRCPPLFLCNLMDFPGYFGEVGNDENCKRIGEVMVKKKEKNPLLVGVCAKDALTKFKDCILKKKFDGFPVGIHGCSLICLENEIKEFFSGKSGVEKLDLKINEVKLMVENNGFKIVVNLGELKVLVDENDDDDEKDCSFNKKEVVLKLSNLVQFDGKKIWLIGFATNYETYSNFVGKFQSVEKDWDLHPLPITSSKSSYDGFSSKSSLMGSFVPFGGFFPTPSDYRPPVTAGRQSFTRCNACNEKYEQELGATLREGSSVPSDDHHSAALPSWLQRSDSDLSKGDVVAQVKDVKVTSGEKIKHLQKRWDDHCRHAHQSSMLVTPGVSLARLQVSQPMAFPFMADNVQGSCSSGDSSLNERACSTSSSGMQIIAQKVSPQQQVTKAETPKQALEVLPCHSIEREHSASLMYPVQNLSLPPNQAMAITVTTDLGLGTIYASKCNQKKPFLHDPQTHLQHFPSPVLTNHGFIKKDFAQSVHSSSKGLDLGDYKTLYRKLSEVAAWQGEAISRISEIVSCCRSGNGRQRAATWLSFLGPDKIGKRKISEALADAMFGSKDRLIAVNLSSQDNISKVNSIFLCQRSHDFDINMSRITVVDHIVQELCKKPHSVVFLENVDEADLVVQNSLSRAIQTGKFQDSRGREIGINNVVFVTTSTTTKDDKSLSLSPRKEFIKFQEEKILEAKNWQMQLEVRSVSTDTSKGKEATVSLLPIKYASNQESGTKRKLSDISDTLEVPTCANKTSKNSLDLNLPLEDIDEAVETDVFGKAWLEGFFGQTDGNVVFKPFDFDALADKLLRTVRSKFEEICKGERISLEIDHEVMLQILAASWPSDKEAIEHWIEQVLVTSFAEAREKFHLSAESVVRLSCCEGFPVKEWASGICLPKRINLGI